MKAAAREHPAGSLLFELEQTSENTPAEDVEGWTSEEERGRWLGSRIARALASDLGERREELDRVYRRTRNRIKRYQRHYAAPFAPNYQGKWIAATDIKYIREFPGVPQARRAKKALASIECFEEIPCNICQRVCPVDAIRIGSPRPEPPEPILKEDVCTSCGLCLPACPSRAIILLEDRDDRPLSQLSFPWPRGAVGEWKPGEFAVLVNRRGEALGNARVKGILEASPGQNLVQVEVPAHLVWEVRSIRRPRAPASEDEAYLKAVSRSALSEGQIEISLNGEKRLVRDQIPLTIALFETGQGRPEDVLFCRDGSCGLCQINVDGSRRLACQVVTHRGMAIRLDRNPGRRLSDQSICPCVGVTQEKIAERLVQGQLQSPEAVISVTHVGSGDCHGRLCMEGFRRLLKEQGLAVDQWIDWRFPWSEWVLGRS